MEIHSHLAAVLLPVVFLTTVTGLSAARILPSAISKLTCKDYFMVLSITDLGVRTDLKKPGTPVGAQPPTDTSGLLQPGIQGWYRLGEKEVVGNYPRLMTEYLCTKKGGPEPFLPRARGPFDLGPS
ncbi:hypothetical protein V8F06_010855 [Rhypophila decipiens]